MNPNLPNPINLDLIYEDDESYLTARQASRGQGVLNAQMPVALASNGFGVRPDIDDEMLVTTATGLNVTVATGITLVGVDGEGLACGIQLSQSFVRGPLPANRDSLNPIYLFAAFDEGDLTLTNPDDENSITRPDSFESRQGIYPIGSTPTVEGQVLLATITTNGSSVTSITPNPNRFIQSGGTGVPDGGETDEVLTKTAPDDGAATWKPAAKGIAQTFAAQFPDTGPAIFTGPSGDATLQSTDSASAMAAALAEDAWGIEDGAVTVSITSNGTDAPNVSAGGTASAGPDGGAGRPASNMVDGTNTTYWNTNQGNGLVQVQLTATKTVTYATIVLYDNGTGECLPPRLAFYSSSSSVAPSYNTEPSGALLGEFTGLNVLADWTNVATDFYSRTFALTNTSPRSFYQMWYNMGTVGSIFIGEVKLYEGPPTSGTVMLTATVNGEGYAGKNLAKLVPASSGATFEQTRRGNQEGTAASKLTVDELAGEQSDLAERVTVLEGAPPPLTALQDVIGINGPTTLETGKTYSADTSGGAYTQAVFSASGKSGQQIRFSKKTSDTNKFTLTFSGGETTLVLCLQGDNVTLQSDGNRWIVVGSNRPLLRSPDGTSYLLGVANGGALTTTAL